MGIFQDVLAWSKDLPSWQSDLLRRLVVHGSADETDLQEVLGLLKAECGLTGSSETKAVRLSAEHLPSGSETSARPSLVRLAGVKGVNALATGQTLQFAEEGVTLVYGRNAAGKSGYSRILKHACKARDVKEPILPNVLETTQPPAEAEITILNKGAEQGIVWKEGGPGSALLGAVAVLDNRCARLYVDASDAVAYMPYGLDVFHGLCNATDELKRRLDGEASALRRAMPVLPSCADGTVAATFIASMSHKTTDEQIESACAFCGDDAKTLAELRTLRANDPAVVAERKRRLSKRVETARASLKPRELALSRSALDAARDLAVELVESRKTASISAQLLTEGGMLPGTGGGPWKQMFLAAEQYSAVAYEGSEFPKTDGEAVCVLCQQPLDSDASGRMLRFRSYVDSEVQKKSAQLQTDFDTAMSALRAAATAPWVIDDALTDEIKEAVSDDIGSFDLLRTWFADSAKSLNAILPDSEWPKFEPHPEVAALLAKIGAELVDQARIADEASAPEQLVMLDAEIAELASREALAAAKNLIVAGVKILKSVQAYEKCISGLGTRSITSKGTAVTTQYVTTELVEGFANELQALGVGAGVAISSTPDKGKVKLGVSLPGCTDRKAQLSAVLSEGEQKAVALSAFLAELNAVGHLGPIVLDDPVSSLDHNHRSKVAHRLTEEAVKRQVIVFTHDIVFVNDLLSEGEQVGRIPRLVTVRSSESQGPGVCSPDGPPAELLDCTKILDQLRRETPRLVLANDMSDDEYKRSLDAAYTLLRKGWERSIETVLFNKVLRSLSDEVQPGRLAGITVESDDVAQVEKGYGRCSSVLHRMAESRDAPLPSTEDFKADVQALDDFVRAVKTRRKQSV